MTPLDEALRLAANGIPVFPCWPEGYGLRGDGRPYYKSPRIAGWQLHASADPATVAQWWQQWPDSLVAVPTGQRSGLYVLDLDRKPEAGKDGVRALQAAGLVPPRTRINHTLTGGMHLLYRLPVNGACRTDSDVLAPGVDRRGDGGYVIWWPAHGGAVHIEALADCPAWMAAEPERAQSDTLPPMGLQEHELHDLLRRIPPERMSSRSEWLRVGMALHHETGGDERGLRMWNAYSCLWPKYDGLPALEREWDTFGRSSREYVTMRSYVPQEWRRVSPEEAFAGGVVVAAPVMAAPVVVAQHGLAALPYSVPNLPMATIDARDGTATTRPLTERGNAMRMHDRYRDVLRYIPEIKGWLHWENNAWLLDKDSSHVHFKVSELADGIYQEGQANVFESMTYVKWARKTQELRTAKASAALLATYPGMRMSAALLDTDPMLVGFDNGRQVIDLTTGHARVAMPNDYVTKSLGVSSVGTADGSPRWLQFLDEVFCGDTELIDWMQRWCGYVLTGRCSEEFFIFAYGAGRNGKGVFFDTLLSIMGEYGVTMAKETLQESKRSASGTSEDIAQLRGMRLAMSAETGEGVAMDEALLKTMTGGDMIAARKAYESMMSFRAMAKIAVMGNHKPVIKGTDWAVWSRVRMVPFLRIFTVPDETLKQRFRDEAPHILAWMLDGCIAWQRRGLKDVPGAVGVATSAYREEMDVIGSWLNDRIDLDKNAKTAASLLYANYNKWAIENGHKNPMSAQSLGRKLGDRGFKRFHSEFGSVWIGLRLRLW